MDIVDPIIGQEIVEAQCRNTGKPRRLTRSEEIGPMADQIRFFAGAARLLEGKSAGEYTDGMTSIVRREPGRALSRVRGTSVAACAACREGRQGPEPRGVPIRCRPRVGRLSRTG